MSPNSDERRAMSAGRSRSNGSTRRDWSSPCGRCCILDLETGPDRHAQVLAGRRSVRSESCLREIRVATVLTFDEDGSGVPLDPCMRTFDIETHGERGVLVNVEAAVSECVGSGTLVTFNGGSFDLPVLRSRQMRWWLTDADAILRMADDGRHVDVMLELSMGGAGRWPTLVDACASLGMSVFGPTRVGRTVFSPAVEKCETDVAATCVLFLYALAAKRRSNDPLRRGLPAWGAHLRTLAAGRPHLETLALSRVLGAGTAWGA